MKTKKKQSLYLNKKLMIPTIFTVVVASCLPFVTPPNITANPTSIETTLTAPPSPTVTPMVEKVLFLSPDQLSPLLLADSLQSTLIRLAQEQEWEVLFINTISSKDIGPDTRLVIAISSDPGLEALSIEHPAVQFLAIGIPGLTPSSNLSLIGPEGLREDRIAFTAGYISAVLTKDWRIGLIHQTSSNLIEKVQGSFSNGVIYYCGLCRSIYPPYNNYPILTGLVQEASESDWNDSAQLLISQSVETAFLFSSEMNLSALDYLLDNRVRLLGVQVPPDQYLDSWVTTISIAPEQVLETHWDDLVFGKGGWIEEIPIVLDDINESLFSPGRQALVQEMVEDLVNGFIATGYALEDEF
jgi:hypothetical protein